MRFKAQLGGGSMLVIFVALIEHYFTQSISWSAYVWVIVACLVLTLIIHGSEQRKTLLPQIRVSSNIFWQHSAGLWDSVYIEVVNESATATIEHVSVRLTRIQPPSAQMSWLPVPLHIKHDNHTPYQTELALNPKDHRHIDLITGFVGGFFNIDHAVPGVTKGIPQDKYRLTIVASGQDVPPSSQIFEVWPDEMGHLRCVAL